jgi:hypothetical protein
MEKSSILGIRCTRHCKSAFGSELLIVIQLLTYVGKNEVLERNEK